MRSVTSIKGAAPGESYQSDFRVEVVEMWGSSAKPRLNATMRDVEFDFDLTLGRASDDVAQIGRAFRFLNLVGC
jgi:hypothetical protein